jgi:Cysteine-rich secretory protein family
MQRVVLVPVVALASACALACGDGGSGPQLADDAILQFCADETNRYRVMDGKAPVERNAELEQYASTGAQLDTEQQRSHGHFGDTQGGGIAATENACYAWMGWALDDGPDAVKDAVALCLQSFYDEGRGTGPFHAHYNILMGDNLKLGCGVFVLNGGVSILQDFGP